MTGSRIAARAEAPARAATDAPARAAGDRPARAPAAARTRRLRVADAVLSLDVRDLILRVVDGEDGPVLLLGDGGACVEISAGLARPGDPEVTAALARTSRQWLRYASLLA